MKHIQSYGSENFIQDTGVSRETLEKLAVYADTLKKWNKKVNLVSRSTIDDLWHRHFLDSAQLFPLFPPDSQTLLDLGSGAGFPGLVLAIMGQLEVHLVEADRRKSEFLREIVRLTQIRATVHNTRIEALDPFPADIVTARALAPLPNLLEWSLPFLHTESTCIFLKGRNVEDELTNIHNIWETKTIRRPSRTDQESTVLCIREVSRVRSDKHRSPPL